MLMDERSFGLGLNMSMGGESEFPGGDGDRSFEEEKSTGRSASPTLVVGPALAATTTPGKSGSNTTMSVHQFKWSLLETASIPLGFQRPHLPTPVLHIPETRLIIDIMPPSLPSQALTPLGTKAEV